MSNTIKTLSAGDITRKAISILHNNLVFVKTIDRQYDDRFARTGAKNGGELIIRNPNEFTVRTGAVMDTQDVTETTQTLTVATQRGVDINFSSVELTLSLDDFADRILKPAMSRLAAEVDSITISNCYPYVYNLVNTAFGTQPALANVLAARAKMAQGLAPSTDRILMCDALAMNNIVASAGTFYNPSGEISKQYDTGLVGQAYGFKFYESEMTPTHTNGSRTDTTPTVDVSGSGITSGDATILMSSCLSTSTIKAGDVFIIKGVYAVNQETKAVYTHEQQFSAIGTSTTALATCTASTTYQAVEVSPTPYTSGARQNCSIVTVTSAALVVHLTAGSSGSASTGYKNSLAFHKQAFTFVGADLEMPQGVDFAAREVFDGISLRVVRQYDIVNDKFPCRIDVLFGSKAIRPAWACRLSA